MLTYPDKILQAYLAKLKYHALKFWRPGIKGRKMGTMNSLFFLTGQIGMKFGQETSIGLLC